MSTRILAATDLSEAADEALRQADAHAYADQAKLAICHVMPNILAVHALFPQENMMDALQFTELEAKVRSSLEERVRTLGLRSSPEIFVEVGVDYAQIVQRAEAWSANMIVVGSRGQTGLSRMLLGSVAEQVIRHAHCQVLLARPRQNRGIVLVGTDLSDPSLPAVTAGAEQARKWQARLVVVHVLDFSSDMWAVAAGGPLFATPAVPPQELREQVRNTLKNSLDQALQGLNVSGESLVLEGPAATILARTAEELGAELVVVGTRGRTGLSRVALGSVAERIVRSVHCSVLAVRLH